MVLASTNEVVVYKQDDFFPDQSQLSNDIIDGPVAVGASIERGNATEAAIQRTTTRGLYRAEVVLPMEQVVASRRDCIHFADAAFIHPAQGMVAGIRQNLPPHGFRLSRNYRIHMLQRLIATECGMNASHHHGHSRCAVQCCDFVGARRLRSEGRYTDEVRFGKASVIEMAQVLVDQCHFPVRRRQSCHHEKPERFPDSIHVQTVAMNFVQADDRIVGINKIESHTFLPGLLVDSIGCLVLLNTPSATAGQFCNES